MGPATLYDGSSAFPHPVEARFDGDALLLTQDNGWSDRIGTDVLKRMDADAESVRLGRTDAPGWRLLLPAECSDEVDRLLGKQARYGSWIDRIGLVPALVAGAAITASVVAFGYVAPGLIAPHVPKSWERNLGSAIVGDFGKYKCRNTDGQRALEALVERVAPGATRGPDAIKVAALDVPVFNAAALPGGYIVVFKPAITQTDTDALAGILAHEVAHVRRRHVTEALLRELGIGALIRLFAGNLGANAEQIVSLSYTRKDEAQADSDAIAMLRKADISPEPTAELFKELAAEQGEGSGYGAEFLQSHPLSGNRAQRFEASFSKSHEYQSALPPDQSEALFNICTKPDVKPS